MENSMLNEAHYQARRAEAHLKNRKFDEATDCHQKAAELLISALKSTAQPKALESIQLQRQYHLRQADLMRLKKSQYEKLCKVMDLQKSKIPHTNEGASTSGAAVDSNLHVAIFRTMEEADSLMEHLLQIDDLPNYKKAPVQEDVIDSPVEPTLFKGSKQPKDDKMVVEELKTLTQHLHDLVKQLVTQLDASYKENESLRAQVRMLSSQLEASIDDVTAHPSPDATPPASQHDSFMATRTLPILAPLEMPQFDFSVFDKSKNPSDQQEELEQDKSD